MKIANAQVFQEDGSFRQQDVFVAGEHFCDHAQGETLDAAGLFLIPGLVDIHLHGCVGHDFCDGTREAIAAIARYEAQNGVTAFSPATMTLPEETLLEVCRQAARYDGGGAMLAGITMEGPFFSVAKKGAQNEAFLRAPDTGLYRRLQEASGGLLKVACVAPELPGAMEFIGRVSGECAVSLAHTAADYDTAMRAFAAGASHVTHLFNAMEPFLHRAPGVVGAAADSGATVELICDGVHLHPAMVRAAVKLFGAERVVLVSDSMMATGLADGEYALGGQAVTVKGGRALLADGTIAGSARNLMDCVRTAVAQGIPLGAAVRMASANPARVIGRSGDMGAVRPGMLANFALLDEALALEAVYIKGKPVR